MSTPTLSNEYLFERIEDDLWYDADTETETGNPWHIGETRGHKHTFSPSFYEGFTECDCGLIIQCDHSQEMTKDIIESFYIGSDGEPHSRSHKADICALCGFEFDDHNDHNGGDGPDD